MVNALLAAALLGAGPATGLLTVQTVPAGQSVYVDGALVGTGPVLKLIVTEGEHTVGLFPNDEIEAAVWQLRSAGLTGRYAALRELAKVDAATAHVVIAPGQTTSVVLDRGRARRAPCRLAWGAGCGLGGIFLAGALAGVLASLALAR